MENRNRKAKTMGEINTDKKEEKEFEKKPWRVKIKTKRKKEGRNRKK
jgi:hypothetical protein